MPGRRLFAADIPGAGAGVGHYSTDPKERVDWALVELHHDGSIAVAIGLGGFLRGADIARVDFDALWVPIKLMDALIAEAVALASVHVRGLGGIGTILARATLLRREDPNLSLVVIDNQLAAGLSSLFHQVVGSRAIREVVAVEAEFSAEDDVTALRIVARQLADDLNHQFGLSGSSIPG